MRNEASLLVFYLFGKCSNEMQADKNLLPTSWMWTWLITVCTQPALHGTIVFSEFLNAVVKALKLFEFFCKMTIAHLIDQRKW